MSGALLFHWLPRICHSDGSRANVEACTGSGAGAAEVLSVVGSNAAADAELSWAAHSCTKASEAHSSTTGESHLGIRSSNRSRRRQETAPHRYVRQHTMI